MRAFVWVGVALAVLAAPATAGEIVFKPIDTKTLVVQPSKAVAAVTAATISIAGKAAANQIEGNGYVKTINNLFGFRKFLPSPTQSGPSALPHPSLFTSNKYQSYNQPVMPSSSPTRR